MKKAIIIALTAVILVLSLCSCGLKYRCDLCGEEKFGFKKTVTVLGRDVELCPDCYKDLKNLKDKLTD